MARRANLDPDNFEPTDEAQEPEPASPEKSSDSDVLVYIDRLGALAFHWNEERRGDERPVGGVVIPVQRRTRLEPGLSFCSGAEWAHVRASQAWVERSRLGAIQAVAGQGGNLVAEWERAKPAKLVGMLAKTYHIPALERLREMESSLARPRLEVAQEIDARLDEMGEKVGRHQEQRRTQRRANRRQVLG